MEIAVMQVSPVGEVERSWVALVIAADPDSLSGKARKAADYGIPIVTEHAFSGMLEELVTRGAGR